MTDDLRQLSLWWDTLPDDLRAPLGTPLPGDTTADVAIVGAGYTGLWTAYYLLQRDPSLRVVILEAEQAGFGASGRNGGWASALFPASLPALARQSTRDAAIRLKREMFATVDEIGRVASAEGWDVEWSKGGTVVAARSPLQLSTARDEIDGAAHAGASDPEDYDLLDKAETERRVGATDVLGGTYTPHCAAIHPARLVRSLARSVVQAGADPARGHPGRGHRAGHSCAPRTATVRAEIVVRATEGYTRTLKGQTRVLAPVYSLMLATEPLPDEAWDQIGLGRARDVRRRQAPDHLRPAHRRRQARVRRPRGAVPLRLADHARAGPQRRGARRPLGGAHGPVPRREPLGRDAHVGWTARRAARLVGVVRPRPADRPGVVGRLRGRRGGHLQPGRAHPRRPDHRHGSPTS